MSETTSASDLVRERIARLEEQASPPWLSSAAVLRADARAKARDALRAEEWADALALTAADEERKQAAKERAEAAAKEAAEAKALAEEATKTEVEEASDETVAEAAKE